MNSKGEKSERKINSKGSGTQRLRNSGNMGSPLEKLQMNLT